ncbi:hypothetical protein CY34DRAFT_12977 [Suillus luteus UH-Slu-Lm8-n1]|uniref:Uncharacterized protein n=1 Tax=Suillus luteus UH-Slu-Lm8-n1 TaxID=930992 RepID=A0A0D0AI69_9AGAM|nr:hypothetical protein CY34DRAFT_12977 [Suillus luteus UH-Slu-Lm8-n1]
MNLPPAVQQFFDLPSDSDLDKYLDKDLSLDHMDSGLTGSPHLHDSDFVLLDREYWNPSRLCLVHRRIFGPSEQAPSTRTDWIADLFTTPKKGSGKAPLSTGSITEPKSDNPTVSLSIPTTISKAPSTGSITAPESDDPTIPLGIPTTISKAPSTGSITEPESDDPTIPLITPTTISKAPESDGSITEPESDDNNIATVPTISESSARLGHHCLFTTPSLPPPDSLYWKYFTKEEDERMYDRSGTDKSFQAVREMKKELQALMDA